MTDPARPRRTVNYAVLQDGDSPDPNDGFATILMRLGGEPVPPNGTIAPPLPKAETRDNRAMVALRELTVGTGDAGEFEVHGTLGQGGMGIVRLASQTSLGRHVAIKSVRPDGPVQMATMVLMREAWVTGALEHPNVVPVHALGRDADGAPMFVMKRIHGTSWRELLVAPELLPPEARDAPRDFHLGVMRQVCNAVAFAHSKGILHRDLKPENVMIGPFGEVYVLDWGLAVSMRDDAERIPRAIDIVDIAGTLEYMAPEMAAADGANISERTDVFQLGAILHEVLTGESRHAGTTPLELLAAAWRSPAIEYGSGVPAELAAIANRATARDPQLRFASIHEFQLALVGYDRHASSRLLSAAAHERLAELLALTDQQTDADIDTETDTETGAEDQVARDARIQDAFIECRVSFRTALGSWPDNPTAHAGLQSALRAMIRHDLRRDRLQSAVTLAVGLAEPDADIELAIEELTQRLAAERERALALERLGQQHDLRFGGRTRAFIAVIFAVIFSAVPIGAGIAKRAGHYEHGHLNNLGMCIGFVLLLAGLFRWARDTLTSTEINRSVTRSLFVVAFSSFLLTFAVWAADMNAEASLPLSLLMFAIYMGTLAALIDGRLFACAGAHAIAFTGAVVWPAYAYEMVALGHFFSSALAAWFWRPERLSGAYDGHSALVPKDG